MTQSEFRSGQRTDSPGRSVITVDELGHAETEDSRTPHTIIHRERLSPERPELSVDLDRLTGSSGEYVINIVLSDFGLPFRTITVNRLFATSGDGEEITYDTSVKIDKVKIACGSRQWTGQTERYIVDNDTEEEDVVLKPGEHVFFAHDGDPSDFRTGFILNDARILAFGDEWTDPEDIKEWTQRYTPIIRIKYEGNQLVITANDDANADVIYEKTVSEADLANVEESSTIRTREHVLEAALARNREHLIEVQRRLREAIFENEQLKRKGAAGVRQEATGFRPGLEVRENDPFGHCKNLALDPEALFNMPPDVAKRVVSGLRRSFGGSYHGDVNRGFDPAVMGKFNDSIDKVLARIKNGSWERN